MHRLTMRADQRKVTRYELTQGDPEMRRYSCAVLITIAAVAAAYGGDTLEEYAQKCDEAIGVTVPDFNCDSGTLVPTTNLTPLGAIYPNGTCDRPTRRLQTSQAAVHRCHR